MPICGHRRQHFPEYRVLFSKCSSSFLSILLYEHKGEKASLIKVSYCKNKGIRPVKELMLLFYVMLMREENNKSK